MSVTREQVDQFLRNDENWPHLDGTWFLRALDHFAPPISRMSVEEIARSIFDSPEWKNDAQISSHFAAAHAVHRLAQPVARVDEDAKAKRLAGIFWRRAEARRADKSDEQIWADLYASQRNGWRAVAEAKEAGDA